MDGSKFKEINLVYLILFSCGLKQMLPLSTNQAVTILPEQYRDSTFRQLTSSKWNGQPADQIIISWSRRHLTKSTLIQVNGNSSAVRSAILIFKKSS